MLHLKRLDGPTLIFLTITKCAMHCVTSEFFQLAQCKISQSADISFKCGQRSKQTDQKSNRTITKQYKDIFCLQDKDIKFIH